MREHINSLKCNVTIAVPVNVLSELDNIADRTISRNKLINSAILNYLKMKYNITFFKS